MRLVELLLPVRREFPPPVGKLVQEGNEVTIVRVPAFVTTHRSRSLSGLITYIEELDTPEIGNITMQRLPFKSNRVTSDLVNHVFER